MRRTQTSASEYRKQARDRALALIEGNDVGRYRTAAYQFVESLETAQKVRLARLLRLDLEQPHQVLLAIRDGWAMEDRRFIRMLALMGWAPFVAADDSTGGDDPPSPLSVRMPKPRRRGPKDER